MSQYPYTGPFSTANQPGTYQTGTGLGTVPGTTGTYTTTGLGTGLQQGYVSNDPHYIPSSTLGTTNIQQQPLHHKRKHRPQSRSSSSSSSSSSSNEEKRAQKGQKKGLGQKIKQIPAKVKQMVTGHRVETTYPQNPNYSQ